MTSPHKAATQDLVNQSLKQERTFGNLENESPMQNGDASDDRSTIEVNDDKAEEHLKFTREMKLLGHENLKTPKSVKRKFHILQNKSICSKLKFSYFFDMFIGLSKKMLSFQK